MSQFLKNNWRKVVISGLIALVLIALLFANEQVNTFYKAIKNVLSPFFTGAVIAFVFNVPVRALERKFKFIKRNVLRRGVAICITALIVLAVFAVLFYLLVNKVSGELVHLAKNGYFDIPVLQDLLKKLSNLDSLTFQQIVDKVIETLGTGVESILNGAFAVISDVAKAVINLFLGLVFAIYCLFQKETLVRQGKKILYAFTTEQRADYIVRFMRLTSNTLSDFLTGQCIEVCILGTMFMIAMAIFRLPYILLISSMIAVLAFIPIVGAWCGCIFGAMLILLDGDPMKAVVFVVLSLAVQAIENNLIYPKVVGKSIGLSGMWVLVAIAVGGAVMGAAGMVLMVPIASVIQTLIREETNKRLDEKEVNPMKFKYHKRSVDTKNTSKKKEAE